MIIQTSHPAYIDQPSTHITNCPKQKELSLLEYKMVFDDYCQMRAMINDYSRDLDDDKELDVFIMNMKYSEFANRVTRDECRMAAYQHKYRGDQLLETLHSVLMMSDSPAIRPVRTIEAATPTRTGANTSTPRRLPRNNRRNARINQIGAADQQGQVPSPDNSGSGGGDSDRTNPNDYHDYDVNPDDVTSPQPFSSYEEACLNLMEIEVPDTQNTPNNLMTFDIYRRAVHAIREDPNVAYEQRCIVCRGIHRFEQCDTLNDHDFLKQHYIRFCQNVRRDQAALSRQREETTNFVDRQLYNDDTDDDDEGGNFRPGRS